MSDLKAKLNELKGLLDEGLLTQAEFDAEKRRVLDQLVGGVATTGESPPGVSLGGKTRIAGDGPGAPPGDALSGARPDARRTAHASTLSPARGVSRSPNDRHPEQQRGKCSR